MVSFGQCFSIVLLLCRPHEEVNISHSPQLSAAAINSKLSIKVLEVNLCRGANTATTVVPSHPNTSQVEQFEVAQVLSF